MLLYSAASAALIKVLFFYIGAGVNIMLNTFLFYFYNLRCLVFSILVLLTAIKRFVLYIVSIPFWLSSLIYRLVY